MKKAFFFLPLIGITNATVRPHNTGLMIFHTSSCSLPHDTEEIAAMPFFWGCRNHFSMSERGIGTKTCPTDNLELKMIRLAETVNDGEHYLHHRDFFEIQSINTGKRSVYTKALITASGFPQICSSRLTKIWRSCCSKQPFERRRFRIRRF